MEFKSYNNINCYFKYFFKNSMSFEEINSKYFSIGKTDFNLLL